MTSASEMRKLIELMEQIEIDEGVFDLFKKNPVTTSTITAAQKPVASTNPANTTDAFRAQFIDLQKKIFTKIQAHEAELNAAKSQAPGLVKNSIATLVQIKQLLVGLFKKAEMAFTAKSKGDNNVYQRLMREFGAMMLQLPKLEVAQATQAAKGSEAPTGIWKLIDEIMVYVRPFVKKIPATFA